MQQPTHPGVYIADAPQPYPSIVPATTSLTAFIGPYSTGPIDEAVLVGNWGEFSARYGGLRADSLASYGVRQFFDNGGAGAWIVRIVPAEAAAATAAVGPVTIEAHVGAWADGFLVEIAPTEEVTGSSSAWYATLTVTDADGALVESLPRLVAGSASPSVAGGFDAHELAASITHRSDVVQASVPQSPTPPPSTPPPAWTGTLTGGADGTWTAGSFMTAAEAQLGQAATPSLLDAIAPASFNLLTIPDATMLGDDDQTTIYRHAVAYCKQRRAFALVDPPPPAAALLEPRLPIGSPTPIDDVGDGANTAALTTSRWARGILASEHDAGAVYYPWVRVVDPSDHRRQRVIPPSGAVAGVYATTDNSSGVWQAPAGTAAALNGITALADTTIDDTVLGELNRLGVNCLRTFPVYGTLVWGARTLAGADIFGSEWKYVPVRRLADFIEVSLDLGLKWVVFEPNDQPLWAHIATDVGAFMQGLYANGAFGGARPEESFTVRCDASTTTPVDQLEGRVNVLVGFAPAYPAEFVMLRISLTAAPPP